MRLVDCLIVGAALLNSMAWAPLSGQDRKPPPLSETQGPGFYELGMELKAEGAWEEALDLWEEASDFFTAPPDPRISFAFLETTVENEDEERYGVASEMLLWGLSGPDYPPPLRGSVVEELERILPLFEEEEAEPWVALRDSSTQKIAWELKRFWIEKDPTPTSVLNERLIEHWQRIVHVRSQFTYSYDSPYRTDDRGPVFVKFGPPGREKSGMLGASGMELKIRVPEAQDREAIRRYDTNPQYEIWVYDELNDQGFTYFLFGNEGGQGRFRLVDGVRELIPTASRSQSSSRYTPGGVPAAYYLELFYYETLSDLGGFFGRRFAELNELWNQFTTRTNRQGGNLLSPSENTLRSYSQRYELKDRAHPENPPLDPAFSAYEGLPREEMVVQTVRVLQENEPRLYVLAVSAPRQHVSDRSGLRRQRLVAPGSAMRHTLIVRDHLLDEVGRLTQQVTSDRRDVSIFQLRHPSLPMHFTVAGETFQTGDSAAPGAVNLGFEEEEEVVVEEESRPLPAQVHFEPSPPLSTDTAHLEVSDLTLGIQIPEAMDESSLPFPLLPASRIWLIDSLRVYLEVYHLGLDQEGAGRFRANFKVVALRDDGRVDESRSPATLSVQLETDGPMSQAPFDIAFRDQELGRYRVEVTVTDLIRGETVSRSGTIELIG